jgi:hypothetical protein
LHDLLPIWLVLVIGQASLVGSALLGNLCGIAWAVKFDRIRRFDLA